jgi:hypothetical protein
VAGVSNTIKTIAVCVAVGIVTSDRALPDMVVKTPRWAAKIVQMAYSKK